jgi:uncharacterized protein
VNGVDTNILVYAHRADSPWNTKAKPLLEELVNSRAPWCIPWPCLYEFYGIVTRPRIYDPPTPLAAARAQLSTLLRSPSLHLLAEDVDFWPTFETILTESQVAGAAVHDARVAALCLHHGVTALLTADRDFSRFPRLKVVNPLI